MNSYPRRDRIIDKAYNPTSNSSQSLIQLSNDLIRASRTNNTPLVQHILSLSTSEIDRQDIDGFTALHHAVSNSNIILVELLLEKGADPNIRTENELKTPLHLSIDIHHSHHSLPSLGGSKIVHMTQQKHIMMLLLDNDAYPFFTDIHGATFSCLINTFGVLKFELFYRAPWLAPPAKLKTLVAQKIITSELRHKITPHIPKKLQKFIESHIPLAETRLLTFTEMHSARSVH